MENTSRFEHKWPGHSFSYRVALNGGVGVGDDGVLSSLSGGVSGSTLCTADPRKLDSTLTPTDIALY